MAKTLLSAASVLILAALSGPCCACNKAAHMLSGVIAYNELAESHPKVVVQVAALSASNCAAWGWSGYRLADVLAALFPAASAASTTPEGRSAGVRVPEETVLRARLKEFWQAVGAHDIVKRYEMTTPTVRARVTLEEFRKTWSWQERPEFPPQNMTAKLSKVCSCAELRLLRCVLSVELTIEKPGEPPTHERTAQMWEFADGQWYEAYSGAPSGRRCPGER